MTMAGPRVAIKRLGSTGTKNAVSTRSVDVGDPLVARAVAFINKRVAETIEKGAQGLLEIGQYVFAHFFHGDVEQVHARGRLKESSFRSLANHADLQLSPTGLHNAVHLAVQEQELRQAGVPTSEHVLMSHKVELLRLSSVHHKKQLLAEVAKARMSVRRLRSRVDETLSEKRTVAKRESGPDDLGDISQSVKALLDLNIEQVISGERLRALSGPQKERYIAVLQEAEGRIRQLIKAMEVAA
jgi:hypothetical protein